jgi:hypothetical protein
VWDSSLKPTSLTVDDVEDEDDSGTRTPQLAQIALPAFGPNGATAVAFMAPVPVLSSSTSSVAPTTSTEAADPYYVSTPKPDITIELAQIGFNAQQQRRLIDYQAYRLILSDPHAAEMGICYPFLVVEAKGLSLTGNLVSVQNQAAVNGACMLAILQDLHNQVAEVALDNTLALCFSITSMSPTHEMNVHFMHEGAFHMYCFRSYRTTDKRDTAEFVYYVSQILEWGKGEYKSGIAKKLNRLPR